MQYDTIRNNITFGKPFQHLKYKIAAEMCCLLKDFEIFAEGDKTVVGERVNVYFFSQRIFEGQNASILSLFQTFLCICRE